MLRQLLRHALRLFPKLRYPRSFRGWRADYASPAGSYPAPVIHNHWVDRQPGWLHLAVVAMLIVQICSTLWVAWRMTGPPTVALLRSTEPSNQHVTDPAHPLPPSPTDRFADREATAKMQFLEEILGELNVVTDGLSGKLQSTREENQSLRAAVVGYKALEECVVELDENRGRATKKNRNCRKNSVNRTIPEKYLQRKTNYGRRD